MSIRWKELAIAATLALVLWFSVSGSEKVESQVDIRVEYKGLPSGYIVRNGLVNKISARVRASAGVLRTLNKRGMTYSLDLSSVVKGNNEVPIYVDKLPLWGGVEVIEVSPSSLDLTVDSLEKKSIALSVQPQVTQLGDLKLEASVQPDSIEVIGPSDAVDNLVSITLPLQLPQELHEGVYELKSVIPLPEGVTTANREALISVNGTMSRDQISVQRNILVLGAESEQIKISPRRVSIKVSAPSSQAKSTINNNELSAQVELGELDAGLHTVPVLVNVPVDFLLISVEPPTVEVSISPAKSTPKK